MTIYLLGSREQRRKRRVFSSLADIASAFNAAFDLGCRTKAG